MRLNYACASLVLIAVGCSDDDPVSVSDVVDLKITLSSGDVTAGTLQDEKNINTESGNPYGVFVQTARDEIGGEPSHVTVDATAVTVQATSNNVTTLGGVFLGDAKLEFVMSSAARYTVATKNVVAADAAGPIAFTVDFDSNDIPAADYTELAAGSFKVSLSGPPAAGFAAANADADLLMSLTFSAFE